VQMPAGSGPSYRLFPNDAGAFTTLDQATFRFERDAGGAVTGLTTNAWGEMEQRATRK